MNGPVVDRKPSLAPSLQDHVANYSLEHFASHMTVPSDAALPQPHDTGEPDATADPSHISAANIVELLGTPSRPSISNDTI
jgi:hypothetical protein